MDNEKKLSEITRKDWILYQWIDDDTFGVERILFRGRQRTPTEALQAAQEWEFLESVKGEDDDEDEAID